MTRLHLALRRREAKLNDSINTLRLNGRRAAAVALTLVLIRVRKALMNRYDDFAWLWHLPPAGLSRNEDLGLTTPFGA